MRDLPTTQMLRTLIEERLLAIALVAAAVPHFLLTAVGLPLYHCPFHQVTGLPCLGCGLTRGMLCLVRGDWHGMLVHHPFAPYFLALGALIAASAILRPAPRRRLAGALAAIEQTTALNALFLSAFVVYGVARLVWQLMHA